MAKKDVVSIDYFGDRERFADLFNVFFFAGEQMIKLEDVREKNRSNSLTQRKDNKIPKSEIMKSNVVNRDIVREIGTGETAVVIATEAQSDIHYAMPVRVMTGDSANYQSQWQELRKEHNKKKDLEGAEYISGFAKEDRLVPITTTVLYLGEDDWDGPRCLKDILNLDQDAFSDLPVDAYDMICQFSHSEALNNNADDYKIGKEKVDMRSAFDDMLAKRELRGMVQGIIKICQELGVSMEVALQKIMKECSLPEDTAMEYIKKYWVQNQ